MLHLTASEQKRMYRYRYTNWQESGYRLGSLRSIFTNLAVLGSIGRPSIRRDCEDGGLHPVSAMSDLEAVSNMKILLKNLEEECVSEGLSNYPNATEIQHYKISDAERRNDRIVSNPCGLFYVFQKRLYQNYLNIFAVDRFVDKF